MYTDFIALAICKKTLLTKILILTLFKYKIWTSFIDQCIFYNINYKIINYVSLLQKKFQKLRNTKTFKIINFEKACVPF